MQKNIFDEIISAFAIAIEEMLNKLNFIATTMIRL
jgi:hypothetical protein